MQIFKIYQQKKKIEVQFLERSNVGNITNFWKAYLSLQEVVFLFALKELEFLETVACCFNTVNV